MSRILFVDDEPFLLAALRRSLRSKRKEWDMHFVESATDALALMQESLFDAIVTDMRMPQMTGTQLVREVVARGHDTVRILLTGQSEQQAIMPCIGLVHRFLSKPCEPKRLVGTLEQLVASRQDVDESIRPALTNLEFLPTQPAVRKAFTKELSSSNPNTQQLARLVASDVGLAAKFVQVAQSQVVSSSVPGSSFDAIVESIGIDVIRQLLDQKRLFAEPRSANKNFDLEAFNLRCVELASQSSKCDQMTALLQNVGELALASLPEFASHAEATNYLLSLWARDSAHPQDNCWTVESQTADAAPASTIVSGS